MSEDLKCHLHCEDAYDDCIECYRLCRCSDCTEYLAEAVLDKVLLHAKIKIFKERLNVLCEKITPEHVIEWSIYLNSIQTALYMVHKDVDILNGLMANLKDNKDLINIIGGDSIKTRIEQTYYAINRIDSVIDVKINKFEKLINFMRNNKISWKKLKDKE